jgi:hypothetical protein
MTVWVSCLGALGGKWQQASAFGRFLPFETSRKRPEADGDIRQKPTGSGGSLQEKQNGFLWRSEEGFGRLYCGSLAITLISKSKPDSQVTPIAVAVG